MIKTLILMSIFFLIAEKSIGIEPKRNKEMLLYIGTYTNEGSKGIYLSKFDTKTGEISSPQLAATSNNPSFQCVTKTHNQLWSVNESWSGTGLVIGYSIDSKTGALTKISEFSSEGNSPCFVSYHDATNNVLAANYSSGDVVQIPVTPEGLSNGRTTLHKHSGTGPNTGRQEKPHAHSIKIDNHGKYIYSCDLGADKIYIYTIENNALKVIKEIITAPGAGPRHIDFHPKDKCMAVVNELNGTVVTYLPDADGCFSIQNSTNKTLPESFKKENKCADIHFSPNGKFLFASNRGHNSIVIYKMGKNTTPVFVDWQTQNLNVTRNFTIDSTGKFLIAANQDGNSVVVFKIDQKSGKLIFTGNQITISKPICLTLIEK